MAGEGTSGEKSNTKTVISLLNTNGTWAKCDILFPHALVSIDEEAYFVNMVDYYRRHHIDPPQFDRQELDAKWGKFE